MNLCFPTTSVRPNRPLRKPLSSPGLPSPPPQRFPIISAASPSFNGSINSPTTKLTSSPLPGLDPPALTVYLCNFCGQQGNFRCKRCKKMPYCSVVCQTKDWKEHRYSCKPFNPESVKERPKESIDLPGSGCEGNLAELKGSESSILKKVYLKDLQASKITSGMNIQATVVEFSSPGRFFVLPQNPEVLEVQQILSAELRKTHSSSGTAYVPCDGEVCVAQFSCDKNWYRGLVQTLATDKRTANILYIDFGNEEIVPIERVRPLPASIQHFCPCAVECRIAGVVPVVNEWSHECCITVRQLLAGKVVTVKLLEKAEKDSIHAVDVLLSAEKLLSSFLEDNGFAQKETISTLPTEQDICAMLNASFENFKCLSDGKDDNKWAQPPEPLTQAVGDQFFVVVTHFLSPSDFVVQKVENAELIRNLQVKLRDHCCEVSTLQNFRPAPGTVCCAQFSEDKQWYRAKVLAYPSEERVCVGYLDFGNSEEVNLGQLLPISSSILALPMQAIPCALAGVDPVGESWSKDCILALQSQLSNRVLRLQIQGAQEGKTLVSLIDEASDPQMDFVELLISAGYATPVNLPTEEKTLTAETKVSSGVPEPLVWTTAELPSDGQTVPLFTSIVESPGKFYCRVLTEVQKLMELEAQLKQHCEDEISTFAPKLGEPCCAPFPGNGAWCRAMVKGLSDDKSAVYFVDYGYSATMTKSQLRSITPKLLALPFQAVCCWLAGVEPIGLEWGSEALSWFQKMVDGQQLSGCVLSVSDQGYGVELVSRGQNMAAALIAAQLARPKVEPAAGIHVRAEPAMKKENGRTNQEDTCHTSKNIEVVSRETPSEAQTAIASEFPCFPVDWRTVELPLNESFQPYAAAVISPSLFYILGPTQVDQQKLHQVMLDLAAYCSTYQASLATEMKSRPSAGAACCAQFTADKNWYRAVILEVGENEICVVYSDYGNTEKVPLSQILPIPNHLLQLPFQITRCTLTGKEHFPAEWPKEVLQLFQTELVNGVLATVQSFDGSANVLSLTLPTARGGAQLTSVILHKLHAISEKIPDTNWKLGNTGSSTPCAPDDPQSKSVPKPRLEPKQKQAAGDTTGSDHQPAGCCCKNLQKQINNLEQIMQLQLALIKQLVGQIK